jgi:hypothetical protein
MTLPTLMLPTLMLLTRMSALQLPLMTLLPIRKTDCRPQLSRIQFL